MEKTMCRIDAPFDNITFEEKSDPKERFEQALDESEVQGNLRTLLIKHFSDSWISVFKSTAKLEEALGSTIKHDSDVEKCIAILLSQESTISNSMSRYLGMYKLPVNDSAIIGFLNDVAQAYYPNSPYGLFNDGMNKIVSHYSLFVSWLYGEDYCFSKDFFDDKSLNALSKHERTHILWDHFNAIAEPFLIYDGKRLLKEFKSLASLPLVAGPPTKSSLEIMRGFDFVKAWIKFDSQAGRLSYCWIDFSYDYNSPLQKVRNLVNSEYGTDEESENQLGSWFNEAEREFKKLLYLNADLSHASVSDVDQWASELNSYLNHIDMEFSYNELTREEDNARKDKELIELCSQLTAYQLNHWVKWSINNDFQSILNSKRQGATHGFSESRDKWIQKEYFKPWKDAFLECFNELEVEGQLSILSSSVPYTNECYLDYFDWWNELFNHLVNSDKFPKKLMPNWTVLAIGKNELNKEQLFPYVDKSLGVLRGELSKAEATEEELKLYHQQLEKLLTTLDISNPTKAQRHRLLLMRSSTVPFSDETISKAGGLFNRENFSKWYDSLNNLTDTQLAYKINGNKAVTVENHLQVKNDFYVNFSHELAEFCLSRLRLRKGEKAKDGKYDSSQIVEQSSIWRQGYLKALTELGFDLNGKVHKTVNFTKKSDPNEDVRSIASECYKAVRRHAKKSPSIQDIKRSIIAAEWWLLMCQRHELGFEVNHEEALKTRRNLMRNP
tara:strand:- start:1243 stop:3420 length:2178 start_codon:yes stop_codon:yes gene_type:complete